MLDMFKIAGKVAVPNCPNDLRTFWIGSVARRDVDGVVVKSRNGSAKPNKKDEQTWTPQPRAHAEARLLQKSGKNATIYVVRISRLTGNFAMSRPCGHCMSKMRAAKVKMCYYTIDANRYGVIKFSNGEIIEEKIKEF